MYVEERCFGVPSTPAMAAQVEDVFTRSFARITVHADHVRVRLFSVPDGIECRAMLRPRSGPTLAIKETRATTLEALMATAAGLARQLERRVVARSRRATRTRARMGRGRSADVGARSSNAAAAYDDAV